MANLKRFPVKYLRDKAKSAYVKDSCCYICGKTSPLDLHHVHSFSQLFTKWCKEVGVVINDLDDILTHRDAFIEAHKYEIYDAVRTLCKEHHKKLHAIYGQRPPLATAEKQLRWIDKQREKLNGLVERPTG